MVISTILLLLYRNGDCYAAMRDVEKVLLLCPMHKKAHIRRVRLMLALGWYNEGIRVVDAFTTLFPEEEEFSSKMRMEMDKASIMEGESNNNNNNYNKHYHNIMHQCYKWC